MLFIRAQYLEAEGSKLLLGIGVHDQLNKAKGTGELLLPSQAEPRAS